MTYDPGRDPQNPLDVNPKPRRHVGGRDKGAGMSMMLGIIALLVVGGFIYYAMSGDRTVATNEPRPAATTPSTTGTATPTPPAQSPATPTTPAPAR